MEADIHTALASGEHRLEASADVEETWRSREEQLSALLLAQEAYAKEHPHHQHDVYEGEDAGTKMMHLMHSDTMIVVLGLLVMIALGLLVRSLFIRLTSTKTRRQQMQGGLKALADHMNSVTRAMSNDLEDHPNSPKTVIRTYSNMKDARREASDNVGVALGKNPNVRTISRENLRVQAFSNSLAKEKVWKPSPMNPVRGEVSIEMIEPSIQWQR